LGERSKENKATPSFYLLISVWGPDTFYCFRGAGKHAGGLVGFGFAAVACVVDFFSVLLLYCRNGFVFKVYEFCFQFKRALWARFHAFAAAVASVRVHYDVVFA
jgi:hypothetical protein